MPNDWEFNFLEYIIIFEGKKCKKMYEFYIKQTEILVINAKRKGK